MAHVKVTEETKLSPAVGVPRFMAWAAAVLAAPFTGGLSLAGGLMFEGLAAAGRREVSRKIDERVPHGPARACEVLSTTLRREKAPSAIVCYTVDLGDCGYGVVKRIYWYDTKT